MFLIASIVVSLIIIITASAIFIYGRSKAYLNYLMDRNVEPCLQNVMYIGDDYGLEPLCKVVSVGIYTSKVTGEMYYVIPELGESFHLIKKDFCFPIYKVSNFVPVSGKSYNSKKVNA